ncbi:MAG: hypothetical protein EPO08_03430 [Rhodospirillaceae bacterium]|nr:MAG: hypothetical protein EPO08_03430 [Rhodospirillaceae bacterium]
MELNEPGNDVNPMSREIYEAMKAALAGESNVSKAVLAMEGMSGQVYRMFINNLVDRISDARYLEIGVWKGSTFCAAVKGNNPALAVAIDNWSGFGGPRDAFLDNLGNIKGKSIQIIERDYRVVDFSKDNWPNGFNIYFYDGPHTELDQEDSIVRAQAVLNDQFVLIVDDWNWSPVRKGTIAGLKAAGIRVDYEIEIRTAEDDKRSDYDEVTDWHNGYFIAACTKTGIKVASEVRPLIVAFAVPTYSKSVSMETYQSMLTLQWRMLAEGVGMVHLMAGGDPYLAKVRNKLAWMFLTNHPEATDLFFIDDDVGFASAAAIDAAMKIISSDKDIVAGIYPKKDDNMVWPVELHADATTGQFVRDGELLLAALVPTGFLRIKRHVLARLAAASPTYKDRDENDNEIDVPNIFEMGFNTDDNKWWGEDFAFCARWRSMGGEIWVYPNIDFTHRGSKAWKGNFADAVAGYEEKMAQPPLDTSKVRGNGSAEFTAAEMTEIFDKVVASQEAAE